MGRKGQKFRVNVVLAEAIYSGLSALVRLSIKRKNNQTSKFQDQIKSIWDDVRSQLRSIREVGAHDFSPVQNVEPPLRRLYLQMLWHGTRRYGNREFKRVYSWRKGTVGPLNALLNIAGAALRDILVPRYPFPDPQLYQVRRYSDGTKKIISKTVADMMPVGKGVETYLKAGYRGNSKYPRILLRHPTLPTLDFGDMIRAHLVELCRQCFIHSVPRNESQRYIRLLIHRLIPFLDWVYTRGKVGRKDFYPDADRELRKIVLEIRTQFGKQAGFKEGISKQIESVPTSPDTGFLKEKVKTILTSTEDRFIKKRCKKILEHIENGVVTNTDISKFIEDVTKKTQQEGNDWHRVLLAGFSHPRSLKEAVFAGDNLLQTPSGIQYLVEVSVVGNQGAGKIDLVLFARNKRSDGRHIWTPVMILEVKSKTGFNFNLYGKRPRTKRPTVYAPVLNSWKTMLKDYEWDEMLSFIPQKDHLDQLDAYEKTLLSEYNALINDPLELKSLWKGVVTLDVSQDYETTKQAFDELVDQLASKISEGGFRGQWRTLKLERTNPDDPTPRIAVTMTPSRGPEHILKKVSPPETTHHEDPFIERVEDEVFFTQYISVPSSTSSGKSAAWLAKNWHLLNHLVELDKTTSSTALFWIDLIGDYPDKKMVDIRFRLDRLKKDGSIGQSKYNELRDLLTRIRFVSIRNEVDSWLFENSSSRLDSLRKTLASCFHDRPDHCIVVVDGWSDVENMVPTNRKNNLQVLELSLLQVMKEMVNEVIWIDDGINHPQMSEAYQRPCLSPFYYDSPRRQVVDEIIWNLPTPPQRVGWMAPAYDDNRVIIQDLPIEKAPWATVIHVPYLKGWTLKFSAEVSKSPIVRMDNYYGTLNQEKDMFGKSFHAASIQVRHDMIDMECLDAVKTNALSLIPSLCRPRGNQIKETDEGEPNYNWTSVYHRVDSNSIQLSLSSRLHLDTMHPPPLPNRLGKDSEGVHVEADKITRGWIHKEYDEPDEPSINVTRRPPSAFSTEASDIDTLDSRRREIQRLSSAATFLRARTTIRDPLFSLYQEVIDLCVISDKESIDDDILLCLLVQIRGSILRRTDCHRLWNILRYARLSLGDLLNVDNRKLLKLAQRHNADLLEIYGMNLFLAVLSVADRVLRDCESPLCLDLWSIVARWQLYQMGFRQQDDEHLEHKYDFQAIHTNLTWRAKQMKRTTSREATRFPEQYGLLLLQEKSDGGSVWLLFPSIKKTIFGVLMEDQISAILRYGWYQGEIDPQSLKERAKDALSRKGWTEYPIVLVNVNGQHVLYTKDAEEWAQSGLFEYGNPPKGQSQPVRWIRLSQPSPETLVALHGYRPTSYLIDARAECDRVLQEAVEWSGVVREVSCFLTINLEKKVYQIDLNEGAKTIARKETPYTDEIIRFLRYPQRIGEYFSTQDGTYLKWDSQQDVKYDEVRIKTKDGKSEFYHLSVFKPLIHRYSFYSDSYKLPATCEDFLMTGAGEGITLRITIDEQRKDRGFRKYLKVQLDGLKERSHLIGLEMEDLGIFDVALLAESGQLVDVDSGLRYDIMIDSEALVSLRLVHLLSEYPLLQKSIVGHIEELESAELEEPTQIEDELLEIEEAGPELRFVSAQVEESLRRKSLDVIVHLCNLDDETDFEELVVLSISLEIAKSQSIAYDFIEQEVKLNLRGRKVNDETRKVILKDIENVLGNKGITIDYY